MTKCSECGQKLKSTRKVAKSERKTLAEAADIIGSAFTWTDSQEGAEYWDKVYSRLHDLADGELL